MVWTLEKSGKFTMKSSYKKMYEEKNNNAVVAPRMKSIFKKLWKLPLLRRINQFLRKYVKNFLPTRDKLSYAIQKGDYSCPFCSQMIETASHCILNCSMVKLVWFGLLSIHTPDNINLEDWICSLFDNIQAGHITEDEICKITIVSWCIWTQRYDTIFKEISSTADIIIQNCRKFLAEYIEMSHKKPNSANGKNRYNLHWSPPPAGGFTINYDGSYLSNSGSISLIMCDFAGYHKGSRCIYLVES
ncbi:uncharacterized protein LOC113306128 [Papaver somniferum]|uniref:uncharacterized protein LOC113306128 n=1 Tax=Papaver somniferum TaxID=3469 RepID=UPI000E6FEB3A|nr:uncharacterized protein LOC113306128 [Papaver somniferum]